MSKIKDPAGRSLSSYKVENLTGKATLPAEDTGNIFPLHKIDVSIKTEWKRWPLIDPTY